MSAGIRCTATWPDGFTWTRETTWHDVTGAEIRKARIKRLREAGTTYAQQGDAITFTRVIDGELVRFLMTFHDHLAPCHVCAGEGRTLVEDDGHYYVRDCEACKTEEVPT